MKAIIDGNNVVLAVGEDIEAVPEGYRQGNTVFAQWCAPVLIDVPEGTRPYLDKYVDGTVVENRNYIVQVQRQAIDDYTMSLIEGGIIL